MSPGAPSGPDVLAGLGAWLVERAGASPPFRVEPLTGGRSNVTELVTDGTGARFVVRRPPPGQALATAHDVVREGRIMGALAGTGVPVPRIIGSCDDPAVVGVPFIVMEHVEGTVVATPDDAGALGPDVRRAAGGQLVGAIAELHGVDVASVGLDDLHRPGGFVERQLRRWWRQWESTQLEDEPLVPEVHRRLAERVPEQQRSRLTHGDPKLVNCILGADGTVLALVDWELAAVGDPLVDLGMLLAYWAEPGDTIVALQDPPTVVGGFPSRDELVERYAARSTLSLAELPYYVAFAYWKLACIVQGVTWRLTRGEANADADPAPFARQVHRLAQLAHDALGPHP